MKVATRTSWRFLPAVFEGLALLAILALAAYLRFVNLSANPGWYSDEGTVAEIARHFAEGRTQYLALKQSTLLAARLPAVPYLVSVLMPQGASALETLRNLTASLGVASTLGAYLVVRQSAPRRQGPLGLLAALMLAIYPPAVFYSRIGFSYNLLTPLVLVVLAGGWIYLDRGRRLGLVLAAAAVGVGSVTDLMMLSIAAPIVLLILFRNPRQLLWWIPLAASPPLIYALSLLIAAPQVLGFDAAFILKRLAAVPWWAQLPLVVFNVGTLALDDAWWLLAIIGLLLVPAARWRRWLLLSFLIPLVLLGRTAGLAGVRLYSISPLFPFLAIGMGNLLWQAVPWLVKRAEGATREFLAGLQRFSRGGRRNWLQKRIVALSGAALIFLLVVTPLLVSTWQLIFHVWDGFDPLESWAYLAPSNAQAAIDYVNTHSKPTDLVVASPAIAWGLDTRRVDFQQVLAYRGEQSVDYPSNVPHIRFAFAADLEQARYAILDPIWREWGAAHLPAMGALIQDIEDWPLVLQTETVEVHENADQP